ncbi:MAG: lamin tail domain-containing protein [Pyrinomonadaceae bacterium]
MKTTAAGVGFLRSSIKQTYPFMLAFLLISQGFVFSSGSVALAQKRSLSVASGQQRPTKRILRAETPQISTGALVDEEIQRDPKAYADAGQSATPGTKSLTPFVTGEEPNPLAPALGTSFDAINFNQDATTTGFFHIPPDPAGAAGPTHVVNVVNTSIEWYTKGGVRQNRQRLGRNGSTHLGSFFESQVPLTGTFDPKVVYDQYAGRFIVVTMERVEAAPTNQSRVFVAVSDDSDPNGTWYFQTLNTEEVIGGAQSWADFPGLAVDSEAVYFTTNMFRHNNQPSPGAFSGQRLWIMAKAPWYTGGTPAATRYDPATLANANPLGSDGGAVITTMQPTQMYGDAPGGVGTYLIAYGGLSDGTSLYLQVIRVDSPLSSPVFTARFSLWGTEAADDNTATAFPGAPQLGTARTIATNDRRFSQNGVFRNGFLYCAAPTLKPVGAPTDANQVTVHWFKIDPVLIDDQVLDPAPTDQGNIGGEDIAVGTYTFFPSVAVDSLGDLAVGFAASGPNIFPGAYFAGRLAADPLGTMQAAGGLRAGRDFYVRTFNSATAASRWGDYSGMWLDPSDELTFWVFNEYALPRGTTGIGSQPAEDGRWGNAWGSFKLAQAGAVPAGAVIISEFRWAGVAGNEDEFIELYNNTDSPITVNDVNPPAAGPSGWAIVSSDNAAVAKAVVPTGVTIPARGHYLIANNTASTGYSLGAYPGGNNGLAATTATPDRTYTTGIPNNVGIALFRSANPASFTLADRLDAVGTASETNLTFKEGTGIRDLATGCVGCEYSWVRRLPGSCTGSTPGFDNHNCTTPALVQTTPPPTSGNSQDTDDNFNDFIFVERGAVAGTDGSNQRLGAPGPENLNSPVLRANPDGTGTIPTQRIDPMQATSSPPNRERVLTPVTNGSQGTIDIRRRFTNHTGQPVTRLRFRIMDITTFPAPGASGIADLRALTSTDTPVTITGGAVLTVRGTTVETPPAQANGGAFNSTMSAGVVTLAAPLANGAAIDVRFVFGVQRGGKFRVFVTVEALP